MLISGVPLMRTTAPFFPVAPESPSDTANTSNVYSVLLVRPVTVWEHIEFEQAELGLSDTSFQSVTDVDELGRYRTLYEATGAGSGVIAGFESGGSQVRPTRPSPTALSRDFGGSGANRTSKDIVPGVAVSFRMFSMCTPLNTF